jgi:hypothetical protein
MHFEQRIIDYRVCAPSWREPCRSVKGHQSRPHRKGSRTAPSIRKKQMPHGRAIRTRRNSERQQSRANNSATIRMRKHTVGPPIVNSGPSFAQSRAIKEAYNARLAKLSYEEKSGALVRTDNVKVSWFNTLRVVRDRTLNLPDRLAPILAAETDPKIVREMLEEELRIILNDASDAITNLQSG